MATLKQLIECEISDFFAGFGHPGEPETPEEMQSQLLARVMPLLAELEQEPVIVVGDDGGDSLAYRRLIQSFPAGTKLYAAPQLPQLAVPDEGLYKIANHIASCKGGMPEEWQDWAGEIESDIRRISLRTLPDNMTAIVKDEHDYVEGWNACRAAMLQGAEPVTTAYKLPFEQWLSQQTGTIDVECGCVMTEVFYHWLRVAYEAGNPPVIQGGRVAVPVDMSPEQMRAVQLNSELGAYAAANLTGAYSLFREFWDVAIAAAPQQEVK